MSPELSQALDALNDQLIEADAWQQVWNEPELPPVWAFPVSRLLGRIRSSAEALEALLRRERPAP